MHELMRQQLDSHSAVVERNFDDSIEHKDEFIARVAMRFRSPAF